MSKMVDITGQRFGKLVAVKYLGNSKWECRCDCGNTCEVFKTNLVRNHTTSCGCARRTKSIIGNKYGRLTVECVETKKGAKHQYAKCKCDCGNDCTVRVDALKAGNVKSCGCLNRERDMPDKIKKDFVCGTQINKLYCKPTKANKSGIVGVNYNKAHKTWQASIRFKGYKYYLGEYKYIQDAIDARKEAEEKIFGNFLEWYENKKPED